jgi:hypothetical protein
MWPSPHAFFLLWDIWGPFFSTLSKYPMGFLLTIDLFNNLSVQRPSLGSLVLPIRTTIRNYEANARSGLPPTHYP